MVLYYDGVVMMMSAVPPSNSTATENLEADAALLLPNMNKL